MNINSLGIDPKELFKQAKEQLQGLNPKEIAEAQEEVQNLVGDLGIELDNNIIAETLKKLSDPNASYADFEKIQQQAKDAKAAMPNLAQLLAQKEEADETPVKLAA